MNKVKLKRSFSIRTLTWIALPILLIAIVAVGGISVFGAHAATSLNGRYNFRGHVTSGPYTGLYLTGAIAMAVDQNGNITGTMCSLQIAEQRCSTLTGTTPDNVHVQLTVGHLKNGYPDLILAGAFQTTQGTHGGFNGFAGTFTLGTSSGNWVAYVAVIPVMNGTWKVFGIVNSGPDVNKQFHGVLTLTQKPNGALSGNYCPSVGTCIPATGGQDRFGYFYFYINITVLNQTIRLQGYPLNVTGSRINGQFESLNVNSTSADRGYWLGH